MMATFVIEAKSATLQRIEDGRVSLVSRGESHEVTSISSAFPLTNPRRLVVLRDEAGVDNLGNTVSSAT